MMADGKMIFLMALVPILSLMEKYIVVNIKKEGHMEMGNGHIVMVKLILELGLKANL